MLGRRGGGGDFKILIVLSSHFHIRLYIDTVNEVDKVCGEVGGRGEGLHFHIKSNQVISKKLRYILGLV